LLLFINKSIIVFFRVSIDVKEKFVAMIQHNLVFFFQ